MDEPELDYAKRLRDLVTIGHTAEDKQTRTAAIEESDDVMWELIAAVREGKVVRCDTCSTPLTYFGRNSGRHPGVYCGNECFAILLNMG